MKKLVALVMALCLLGASALAETAVINWKDIETVIEEKGLNGKFFTVNAVNVKFWVPEGLEPVEELPEELKSRDIVALFADEDLEKGITVVYTDLHGKTIEEYADALPDYGADHISVEVINGLTAVEYANPQKGNLTVGFLSDTGKLLEITMSPVNQEVPEIEWAVLVGSIQPA